MEVGSISVGVSEWCKRGVQFRTPPCHNFCHIVTLLVATAHMAAQNWHGDLRPSSVLWIRCSPGL